MLTVMLDGTEREQNRGLLATLTKSTGNHQLYYSKQHTCNLKSIKLSNCYATLSCYEAATKETCQTELCFVNLFILGTTAATRAIAELL